MAATLEAQRLTAAHRLAQARLGVQTIAAMHVAWSALDPLALDDTFPRWLLAATPIVNGQRVTSARLAANYMTVFKALEVGPSASVPLALAEALAADRLATSLLVTGPVTIKRARAAGASLARAADLGEASAASAAMRHALNGGRDTIISTVRADRQALGWARATSGAACAFCAMLASRGPVYDKDTVDFEAHDHCSCSAEPVYRDDSAWPAGSDRYHDLWQEAKATAAGDGVSTESVFRSLVEA